MNTAHPLARNLIQHQRKNAKTYACPLCDSTYHHEAKIYDHGVRDHPGYLAELQSQEKAEAVKEQFCRQAIEKAQQKATAGPAAESGPQRQPFAGSRKRSEKNINNDDPRLRPPSRPVSAPDNSQGSKKQIHDIRDLSLDQTTFNEQKDRSTQINNPRKRGAEGESGLSGPPIGDYKAGPMGAKPRHGHTLSGGLESDSTRQGALPDNSEYRRASSGPRHSLFEPNIDSPNTGKGFRREKHHNHTNPIVLRHPTGLQSTDPVLGSTRKDNAYPHAQAGHGKIYVHQLLEGSDEQAKQGLLFGKDRDDHSSESTPEDDPPEKDYPEGPSTDPEMLLQPETRPISHEQLVVEVKGIYAGLVMVEAKCIEIDERQSAAAQERDPSKRLELKNDQWQSLIALHKQLLHEHHDFFLASQHPSASVALSKLAAKYSMPARMWRHGIHAFLEVLRHRLPESLEHMLAFIYIAYSMVALLYETVPAFEDTWIECLGDLGRYRMAIEDDEPKDREVWSNVAKFWYNKASDNTPNVGRLYHHLAILARPYSLEQLSLYTRSLTCVIPFESAKGSIMTLFNPVLHNKDTIQRRPFPLETLLIRAHAILFTSKQSEPSDLFKTTLQEIEKGCLFERYIVKTGAKFKEIGPYIATSAIAGLFQYGYAGDGKSKSSLRVVFEYAQVSKQKSAEPLPGRTNTDANRSSAGGSHSDADDSVLTDLDDSTLLISLSSRLASLSLCICLKRPRDSNVHPLVHVYLGFMWSLIIVQQACRYFEQTAVLKIIEKDIPWVGVCYFLNTLAADCQIELSKVQREEFPRPLKESGRPLPEDYTMRGQLYTRWYFPGNWFTAVMIDDDERLHDPPSMTQPRKERMLWLGHRIASAGRWICFDKEKRHFVTTNYANETLTGRSENEKGAHDQDTVMSEVGSFAEDTPRTMSLAPSESTRASTPTEAHEISVATQPMTPKAVRQISPTDDVPMIDISPGKHEQITSPRATKAPDEVSSPPFEAVELPRTGNSSEGNIDVESHNQ